MWDVLKNNPGKIHSFSDFCREACLSYNSCMNIQTTNPPVTTIPSTTETTPSFPVCSSQPTLKLYSGYSSSGMGHLRDAVMQLQTLLNTLINAGLTVDGFFGPLTETAVKSFQSSQGIQIDGIVGPVTWSRLC